jgi:uncharacterized protein (TIGR03437 family)
VQSAAAASVAVAPNSLASMYGTNLAPGTAQATMQPLPLTLGQISLTVTDSSGVQRSAPLIYVSAGQINFMVPDGSAAGSANFAVLNGSTTVTAAGVIQSVAPTLFSANSTGTGVAAATAIRTQAAKPELQSPLPVFLCTSSGCVSVPIALGVDTPVFLTLYGTGIRNRSAQANVVVKINNMSLPAMYAGPTPNFAGLDQVNVSLTLDLRGSGETNVVVIVDGQVSNAVKINIQ